MATNAYEQFVGRENARIVHFLDQNHSVSGFVQAIIEHMVGMCKQHNLRPEDLEITLPYIVEDRYIRAEVRRKR